MTLKQPDISQVTNKVTQFCACPVRSGHRLLDPPSLSVCFAWIAKSKRAHSCSTIADQLNQPAGVAAERQQARWRGSLQLWDQSPCAYWACCVSVPHPFEGTESYTACLTDISTLRQTQKKAGKRPASSIDELCVALVTLPARQGVYSQDT